MGRNEDAINKGENLGLPSDFTAHYGLLPVHDAPTFLINNRHVSVVSVPLGSRAVHVPISFFESNLKRYLL